MCIFRGRRLLWFVERLNLKHDISDKRLTFDTSVSNGLSSPLHNFLSHVQSHICTERTLLKSGSHTCFCNRRQHNDNNAILLKNFHKPMNRLHGHARLDYYRLVMFEILPLHRSLTAHDTIILTPTSVMLTSMGRNAIQK